MDSDRGGYKVIGLCWP